VRPASSRIPLLSTATASGFKETSQNADIKSATVMMKLNGAIGRRTFWAALGTLWLGGVVAGLCLLAGYENRPGVAAAAPSRWPAQSRLEPDTGRATLVMLAHPRCDCTRASVAELMELMARTSQRPKAYVVFIKPSGVAGDWARTDLWRSAAQIPDVTVVRDDDGREAALFGAETSGQTVLYGVDGRLLFSGGTTGARGHAGDNAGRATILALLNREDPHRATSPVFGFPLFSAQDARGSKVPTSDGSSN
jgi:hypothetical protein